MAAISRGGLIDRLWNLRSADTGKSSKVHDIAVQAYKRTNGPTDELRRVYRAYRDNQAKSTKARNDRDGRF